jgi:hypothetical protein
LELTGANSKPRRVPEDNVSESSTEYHAKFVAHHSSSEGEDTRLGLERQLSVLLAAQTERDQRIARLTDELALKNAQLEQAEANAVEGKGRARLEPLENEDRLLAQTSLVKQRNVELVDTQPKLRDTEAGLDELLLPFDQQNGRYGASNVRAELKTKKDELETVRLRLTDGEDGWAKSRAKADTSHTVTAASLVDLNEDRTMCEPKEDMQVIEKGIEAIECRNEG